MHNFSWTRLWAIITKEFIQIKRDRPTLGMIVGIPLMQLILFGFAINTNPRHLPTAVVSADQSVYTRTFFAALHNSSYFELQDQNLTEKEGRLKLATGEVLFVITVPPNFTRDLVKGLQPQLLIESDATDPVSTNSAVIALNQLANNVFNPNLQGALNPLQQTPAPTMVTLHPLYNPTAVTQFNIVPGLLGVVLTMTMVIITAMAMTREKERGTMENLLATPVNPLEVMVGKIVPYITLGYTQAFLILLAAYFIFRVPITGSVFLLLLTCFPFIAANLTMGLTFSTIAKNQLQASQSAIFFFLPSLLLSGFMFPFKGMPQWAQWIGELLPLTHFVRITRGILLKGNGLGIIWQEIWPILLFTVVVILIGLKRFRRTLD